MNLKGLLQSIKAVDDWKQIDKDWRVMAIDATEDALERITELERIADAPPEARASMLAEYRRRWSTALVDEAAR